MQIFPLLEPPTLFISPAIDDWEIVREHDIRAVIDLDGGIDAGVSTRPNDLVYVYFPIYDEELPDLACLNAVGELGASLIRGGVPLLSHCGMGFNRSALIAGVILNKLGMPGPDVVRAIRSRRKGALFNDVFANYLEGLR
ncbi:MAG: protein-tyrosine phosphatase family protein [Thermoanaerobaculia bacterium]